MAGLGGSLGYAMGGIDWGIFGKFKEKLFLKRQIYFHQSNALQTGTLYFKLQQIKPGRTLCPHYLNPFYFRLDV
jgi:hypothetical protein